MAGFLQDFLHADFAALSRKDPPRVYLAVFGKHPGWNDHIEDIGLDSAALISAKRFIYLQGLSGQIDANAWEKLDESARRESFDHWLLWHRPGECLVGRLWSSSDGKGRTRYPMILLAHTVGAPLAWALAEIMPVLDRLAERCRQATTAADVHAIAQGGLQDLRQRAQYYQDGAAGAGVLNPAAGASLAETDVLRIFHVVANQLPTFAPGTVDMKSESAGKGRHVRLPAPVGVPAQNLAYWTAFLLTQLEISVPTLVLLPVNETWVDAIIGEPTGSDFFCLRANRKSLPLATDVPYQLTDTLRAAVAAVYDGPIAQSLPARSLFSRKPTGANVQALLTSREELYATAADGLFKKFRGLLGA